MVNCTSGDCHVSACNFQYSLLSFNPSKILELASMIVMCVLFRDFFGLSSDFPVSRLMTKAGDESRLFYVSPALKQLIDCNQTVVNVSIIQLLDQSLSSDTLGIASWKWPVLCRVGRWTSTLLVNLLSPKFDMQLSTLSTFADLYMPSSCVCLSVCVCVCVCVCLSHSGIISKRLNVGSRK